MKKINVKILLFLSIIAVIIATFSVVNAATIKETTENDEFSTIDGESVIIGSFGMSKYSISGNNVLTANKAATAGARDVQIYLKVNGSLEGYTDPTIYYYSYDEDFGGIWYKYNKDGKMQEVTNVNTLPQFNIYYVEDKPKTEISEVKNLLDVEVKINQVSYTFIDDKNVVDVGTVTKGEKITVPAAPTKEHNSFRGWYYTDSEGNLGDEVKPGSSITIEDDTVIVADWTLNQFEVKFVNEDGTELQSGEVAFGEMPAYTGETPTKVATAEFSYTFAGWDKDVAEVTENVTYTATYTNTVNKYLIKFVDFDGSEIKAESIEYGIIPTCDAPTRIGYTFIGWDTEIVAVQNDATYTAQYEMTKYTVSLTENENGTVVADKLTDVTMGEEITITLTSKTGYVLKEDSVKVCDEEDNEVALVDNLDGTYTFTMPASNVIVEASFELKYIATVSDGITGGLVSVYNGAEGYFKGDMVELTITPNTGYELDTITATYGTASKTPTLNSETGRYEFEIDAKDVEVNATFKKINYTINTVNTENGSITVPETAQYGDVVTVVPSADEGYVLDTISVSDANENNIAVNNDNTFELPASDVTVNVTFKLIERTIVLTNTVGGNVKAEVNEIETDKAVVGDSIIITATPTENRYVVKTIEVDGVKVEFNLNENVATYTFTMPAADVTVDVTFEMVYTVTIAPIENGTITAEPVTSFKENEIKLTVNPDDGYSLNTSSLKVTQNNGKELAYTDNGDGTYTFTILGRDVTVTAEFEANNYILAYNLNDGIETTNPVNYTVESNDIVLAVPTKTGYTFTGWTGTDLTEATLSVTIAKGSIGNRTYTANWEPTVYSLTYNLNDGILDESIANPEDYTIETETFTLNNPSKIGYTFDGWTLNDEIEKNMTITIAQGSLEDRIYTANWKKNAEISIDLPESFETGIAAEFTISTIANDYAGTKVIGVGGLSNSEVIEKLEYYEVQNGIWYELSGNFGSAAGFDLADASSKFRVTFKTAGEYTVNFGVQSVADGTSMASDSKTFTVVATDYTVEKINDLHGAINCKETAIYGEEVTVTLTANDGYTFGAITVKDANENDIAVTENKFIMPTSNVTVSAVTIPNIDTVYKIEYYQKGLDGEYALVSGDTKNMTGTTDTLASVAVEDIRVYDGFTHNAETSILSGNIAGNGSLILKVMYDRNLYKAKFDLNNGEEDIELEQEFGTTLTAPISTKVGYDLTGWTPAVPSIMPAVNTSYTAVWTPIDYTVAGYTGEHGKVVASKESVNIETANYGDIVTLTLIPDEDFGLAVDSLKVTTENGDEIALTVDPENANMYTFTMPAENVTVFANFTDLYTVTVIAEDGTISISDGVQYTENTIVEFTVTPNDGYVLKGGGLTITDTYDDTVVITPIFEDGKYTFIMQGMDTTITAVFEELV